MKEIDAKSGKNGQLKLTPPVAAVRSKSIFNMGLDAKSSLAMSLSRSKLVVDRTSSSHSNHASTASMPTNSSNVKILPLKFTE